MDSGLFLHKNFGLFSADQKLCKLVERLLSSSGVSTFTLTFHQEPDKAIEFLNYELPDILIVDLDSRIQSLEKIQTILKKDPWLAGIGIIGVFTKEVRTHYIEEAKKWNLICLVDKADEESFQRVLNIVLKNNLMVDNSFTEYFKEQRKGQLIIRNSIEEAERIANLVSTYLLESHRIDVNKFYNLNMGLSELLINAIEHGNCNISFENKTVLLEKGINLVEYVKKLAEEPAIKNKYVTLDYEILQEKSTWTITDMGNGFEVSLFMTIDPSRLLLPHGRGIMMAKNSSDELHYNEKGNQVTLVCHHKNEEEYGVPFGFRDEEEKEFKAGELVFQEGDSSASLYYILCGEFDVTVKDKKVGHLNSTDMFLGEMSFLLNNKRSATVVASKPSKVLIIPKKSFIKIIKQYPNYLVLISRLLAHRLARANVQALPYV